jgi:hypothetical protein
MRSPRAYCDGAFGNRSRPGRVISSMMRKIMLITATCIGLMAEPQKLEQG